MPSTAPVAGTQLLQYRVIERLGAGGMGEVFLAEDTRLGRQVALKFLTSADAQDPEARARLIREAQAASVLRSPNVAVTYDLVEHGSDLFIAMEYVEGELLSDRIARSPLAVPEALEIAMQVADALDEAHGQGIVHRDIKSANVMLTKRQLVKVLDFGLAKFLRPQANDGATMGMTIPGVVLGTLNYMAPEQLRGGAVDHRADLFAVGAVLYEMLAGRVPFQADTMADSANRILNQEPEALARFNYAVPADVDAVVRKALAKDPDYRYQSARELYVDLHHARERIMRESTGSGQRVTWRPGMLMPPVGFGQPATPAAPAGRTVAVLTFANLTGNPADEWVGQGMAESLTADFAKVRGLKTIPREQMFDVQRELSNAQGRVDERQTIELGRRLGATWVVGGAVQRLGERVRVTAQTIAVEEGRTVSSVKLDGTMDGIFELQDRLVEELVRQGLQRELEQSEKRAIEGDIRSPEAYEAYSRGMLNLRLAAQESVERAIALFERALDLDADYPEALIALGSALQLRGSFLSMPHVLERSKALLERAVAIAPKNAEAHVRLGQTLATLGDTDAAEAAIRHGLALEPESPLALTQLARLLWLGRGQIDNAIAHFTRAATLAPQAGYTHLQLALLHSLNGRSRRRRALRARSGRPAAAGDVRDAGPHHRRRPHPARLRPLPARPVPGVDPRVPPRAEFPHPHRPRAARPLDHRSEPEAGGVVPSPRQRRGSEHLLDRRRRGLRSAAGGRRRRPVHPLLRRRDPRPARRRRAAAATPRPAAARAGRVHPLAPAARSRLHRRAGQSGGRRPAHRLIGGARRPRGRPMFTVHEAPTAALTPALIAEIRALLDAAFDGDFSDHDWQHAVGGVHVWVSGPDGVVSHGSLVTRTLVCDGQALRVGYVEAVATVATHRRQGHGAAVMRRIGECITARYPLGALSTGTFDFYAPLGWERWRGPTFVDGPGGRERTPDDDDDVMILRTARSPVIALDGDIVCDWRPGDVW